MTVVSKNEHAMNVQLANAVSASDPDAPTISAAPDWNIAMEDAVSP